jgi:hypothetical protein
MGLPRGQVVLYPRAVPVVTSAKEQGKLRSASRGNVLFADARLGDVLDAQGREVDSFVGDLSVAALERPDAELEREAMERSELEPVLLHRDQITTAAHEEDIDVSRDPRRFISDPSRPFMLRGTRLTFFVPFQGDPSLLRLTPSSWTSAFPSGRIERSEIVVEYSGVDLDAEAVKAEFERNLAQIERYLGWSTPEVERFNQSLSARIRAGLLARRAKIERDQAVVTGLGYKTRTDPPTGLAAAAASLKASGTKDAAPSATDELDELVRSGESGRIEFKSSLRWDRRLKRVNKELQDEVVQAIAGFLNADGGDLLIGVDDDGATTGIEDDVTSMKRHTEDAFLTTVAALVADRIGAAFAPFVHPRIVDRSGMRVCRVNVQRAATPAFVDVSEFFVRIGTTTRRLDARATHEYIETHRPRRTRAP